MPSPCGDVGQDDRGVGVARRLDRGRDARGRRRLPREVDLRAEQLRLARVVDADRRGLAGGQPHRGLHRVARADDELVALAVARPDAPAVDPQRREPGLQQREAIEARLGRRDRARPARRPQRPDARGCGREVDRRVGPRERGRASKSPLFQYVAWKPARRRGRSPSAARRRATPAPRRRAGRIRARADPGQRCDRGARGRRDPRRAAADVHRVVARGADHRDRAQPARRRAAARRGRSSAAPCRPWRPASPAPGARAC